MLHTHTHIILLYIVNDNDVDYSKYVVALLLKTVASCSRTNFVYLVINEIFIITCFRLNLIGMQYMYVSISLFQAVAIWWIFFERKIKCFILNRYPLFWIVRVCLVNKTDGYLICNIIAGRIVIAVVQQLFQTDLISRRPF